MTRRTLYLEHGELARFLNAVDHGEMWEAFPLDGVLAWRVRVTHCVALVRPNPDPVFHDGAGFAWGVKLKHPDGTLADHLAGCGWAPDEHEAMRAAERVIEEHRPQTTHGQGDSL